MLAASESLPGPAFAVVGLLFTLAGFVMVKHHRRIGAENERRNIRFFGPRIGPHVAGAGWQVRQTGFFFMALGLGWALFFLVR